MTQNYAEYETKLDAYYYDKKRSITMVVIKIRNKRTAIQLPLKELLCDKRALSTMHPIDLCIIGIISNRASQGKINKNEHHISITDDFFMEKLTPMLEIVGRNYTGAEEIISLKLNPLNTIIQISSVELYDNKSLINAMKYLDSISVGYSIGESTDFAQEKITRSNNNFSSVLCIGNSFLLSVMILSTLMIVKPIYIQILWVHLRLHGEILFLPLIFFIQNFLYEMSDASSANKFMIATLSSLVIFFIYFGFVSNLPYPKNNFQTMEFNILHHALISEKPIYILSLTLTIIINIFTFEILGQFYRKFNLSVKYIFINCTYVTLFFWISIVICNATNQPYYTATNYVYSIFAILTITSVFYITSKCFNFARN